jgi:hypothetical protein
MNRKTIQFGLWMAAATLVSGALPAWAQSVNPQFGMVGLASGETLRLNVVAYPPNPCNATIGFLNHDGAVPPNQPVKTVSLSPGQSDFVDLTAAALGIPTGGRREFQPVVLLAPQPDPNAAPSVCAASVELFIGQTGASQVAVSQPDTAAPNVAPQFGMAGIALGQTLRLNVVAWPPDPCVAMIGFLTSSGQPAPVPDKTVSLNPNEADFVDLHAAALGLQAGERAELQPVVMLLPGPAGVSTCQANAQVFATSTGRTRVYLNPQPLPPRKTPS